MSQSVRMQDPAGASGSESLLTSEERSAIVVVSQAAPESGGSTESAQHGFSVSDETPEKRSKSIERDDDTDDDKGDHVEQTWSVVAELLQLSSSFAAQRASWVIIQTTDSAFLGHVSTEALSAAALANLWTNCSGVFTYDLVLTTLVSNATGSGQKKLAGLWLQVSLLFMAVVVPLVMLAWMLTAPVLRAMGEDAALAEKAGLFAFVLAWGLPAKQLQDQLGKFFSAQKQLRPAVYATVLGAAFNLLTGLLLVFGFPVPGWSGLGFVACPLTTVAAFHAQLLFLVVYACAVRQLHSESWPGWSLQHITWRHVREYAALYLPANLSMASDIWRVTVVGALAAGLGVVEVAVFNTGYRITFLSFMFTGSVGEAVAVRVGTELGAGRLARAQQLLWVGLGLVVGLLVGVTGALYAGMEGIALLFSNDQVVLSAFERVKLPLALFVCGMNLNLFLERTLIVLGRPRAVLYAGIVGSWLGQVPGVLLALSYWERSLAALYWGVVLGYAVVCAILAAVLLSVRWHDILAEATSRGQPRPALEPAGARHAAEREADDARDGQSVRMLSLQRRKDDGGEPTSERRQQTVVDCN